MWITFAANLKCGLYFYLMRNLVGNNQILPEFVRACGSQLFITISGLLIWSRYNLSNRVSYRSAPLEASAGSHTIISWQRTVFADLLLAFALKANQPSVYWKPTEPLQWKGKKRPPHSTRGSPTRSICAVCPACLIHLHVHFVLLRVAIFSFYAHLLLL